MKRDVSRLMTPDEIAAVLRITRKTVIIMAREGRIPCIRVGRIVRFDSDEIQRWIDGQRR